MSNKAKRVNALRHGDNVFFEGDMVKVAILINSIRYYKGKILLIDELSFSLDCSKSYGSHIRVIEYEDVIEMDHVSEDDNDELY